MRRLAPLAFLVLSACAAPKVAPKTTAAHLEALPFIHDDYPKALAEAKRRQKPLFVDAWAPWCHSCQSLRSYVLTDPALTPLAEDFVWLSVDTEKDGNAAFVARYPHSALPTLWVIEPSTEKPLLKWIGSAKADELKSLLTVAVSGKGELVDATAAFVRGNHAAAEGHADDAEKAYREAVAAAPKGHPQRAPMVEALVTALQKKPDDCTTVAVTEAPSLAGTSRASTIVLGLACARSAKRAADETTLTELALAGARDARLLPDDRSALYEEVAASRKEVAQEWVAFLDAEAARAPNPDVRASLDPLRLSAALALKDPARTIPMLEQSEKDFPSDYNPPARLGRVYLELGRLDDADRATDRAVARVYGPRAMRVLGLKADIAKARGDRQGEIKALEEALARSDKAVLTEGQKPAREALAKRLAALR